MAVISPAIGVQSGSHSALAFRQLGAALTGAAVQTFAGGVSALDVGHGLVRSGQLAVTQNGTPNMSVNVGAGTALVNGSSVLAQGIYAVTNDATVNLAIATADATNPRRDLVVVQVRDNTADASGFNDARLFVVTGTPAASPVDPTVPAGCLVLARVAVAALASSIVNANITTLAGLARGSNWNVGWGNVGYVNANANTGPYTAAANVSGLVASCPGVSGRLYRVEAFLHRVRASGGGGGVTEMSIQGSVSGAVCSAVIPTVPGSDYHIQAFTIITSVAQTFQVQLGTTGSQVDIACNNTSDRQVISITDIGPA